MHSYRHYLSTLTTLLSLLLLSFSAKAIVAKPGPVSLQQPDGTVKQVYLHGDEYFHYMTDASGKVLERDAAGYIKSASLTSADVQKAAVKREKSALEMRPLLAGVERPRTKASEVYHHKGLVILVNFKDNSFSINNPKDAFSRMLNEEGYSDRSCTGSARDYYVDNSCGQFIPSFDVYGPYTLPHVMEYYGGNENGSDKDPWQMAIDAVDAAYADGVVLSDYDNDKDGILDYVFIYYAGYGEASGADSKTIWPHASTMYYHEIEKGGVRYGNYACGSELIGTFGTNMDNIGTFCHEFGHILGLMDLYDTDYDESGGESMALGNLSLMSSGCYNNNSRTPPCLIAEERATLGWMELKTLKEGNYSLPPIASNEAYYLATDNEGEYFLFENRKKEGWDKFIYNEGMLIYHVDKSANIVYKGQTAAALWSMNGPNIYPEHECMKVMPADGSSLEGASYPGSGNKYTSFTAYTTPSARAWSKMPLSLELSGISLKGDGNVSFTASKATVANELMGKVTDYSGNSIEGATLTLTPASGGSSKIAYSESDGSYLFEDAIPSGNYTLRCEATDYEAAEQSLTMGDSPVTANFQLMKVGETEWRFSWSSNALMQSVGSDEAFSVAALWEPEDITLTKKLSVKKAGVYIYQGKPSVTARVYVDGELAGEKKVSSSNVRNYSYTEVDFSDLGIRYMNTQSLQIVFLFSGQSDVCYIGMDGGPAKVGKGDLCGDGNGKELASIYESDKFDCNWLLYTTLGTRQTKSLGDELLCLSGQKSLYMEWEPEGETWSCKLTGEELNYEVDTLTTPNIYIDNLKPGGKYEITLEGYSAEDGLVAQYTFTQTMDEVQNRPMAISYSASYFKSNGKMLLEVLNLPDNAKVTWMVDGKEYKQHTLDYTGKSRAIEAHVYLSASEGTEIIRRKTAASDASKSSLVNGRTSGTSLPKFISKKP